MNYIRALSLQTRRVLALLQARMGRAVDREELLGLGVTRLRARISELRFRRRAVFCHEWRERTRPGFRGSVYILVDMPQLLEAAEFVGRSEPGDAEPPSLGHLRTFLETAARLYGFPDPETLVQREQSAHG